MKGVREFRQKSFTNAPSRPLSTGLSGSESRLAAGEQANHRELGTWDLAVRLP